MATTLFDRDRIRSFEVSLMNSVPALSSTNPYGLAPDALISLESANKEWQKAYLVQHQRGEAMGAAQSPKWMIWVVVQFGAR